MSGKGDKQRPTDFKKWSNNYDNIKWTREEDEEFASLQDRLSTESTVAQARREVGETTNKSQD